MRARQLMVNSLSVPIQAGRLVVKECRCLGARYGLRAPSAETSWFASRSAFVRDRGQASQEHHPIRHDRSNTDCLQVYWGNNPIQNLNTNICPNGFLLVAEPRAPCSDLLAHAGRSP